MNTIIIKFGQGTAAWEEIAEIVKFLGERGYALEPEKEIGTVKLTKKIIDELVDKKKQLNCDLRFRNQNIEEKSIYQFDEHGDIVACVECEKKVFEQLENQTK
ncbi:MULTISPECIES: hypothetical protein [Bacillus cereus group]|uniref:DUF8088 domain-containing protein n=1 Tax=Bacillus thuringiensis TaxID=1428 RepID=A0AAW9J414_BACTU|nr:MULTISPECIES: hypothetical protein [Bacillus cereus group]MDZ5476426.1 hypothetical protein [Bacillus thuringiensis]MRB35557.1 hypothetical protein [Bacillus thuringiensis]